jgi:3-hydroxybutyryl-CoA dehydrogenase
LCADDAHGTTARPTMSTSGIPDAIGVIGAGTMGAGIAQLAAQAGARTLLHDPVADALSRGVDGIGAALERQVAKGRLAAADAAAIRDRIEPVADLSALAPCGIVIEAAPERLEIKTGLFGQLAAVVDAGCVLATNTSSLSVTEIAAATPHPERVVGLHFFNPAPVMRLVEVVAGEASSPEALATARAVGEAMGKRVVDAADIAGFLVNRCNRPFSLEALRLLEARIASVEQIDRIARLGGGFRMGPFELMDLIGIETNHAVAESLYRAGFGEPRYRPSPLQARLIAAGRLGRKTGRGWYAYDDRHRLDVGGRDRIRRDRTRGGGGRRTVVVTGALPVAVALREAAASAGFDVRPEPDSETWLTLDCDGTVPAEGPRARLLHDTSLHLADPVAAGFHLLPPLDAAELLEVTATPRTDPLARGRLEEFAAALGWHVEPVADAPGLVLGRIVAQLINEAAFLIGEGNGDPADVDAGMELGVNHPRGPVRWAEAIGLEHVLGILDALRRELGEERYRAAPLLRRRAALLAGLG